MKIPRDQHWDSTLPFMSDPYRYISRTCNELGSPLFQTRFLLAPVICMTGPEAAALFYDPQHFQRQGAAPFRLRATLFGFGGVQGLDGERHRHRKQMFLSITTGPRVQPLVERFERHLRTAILARPAIATVCLYDLFQTVLCRAATEWAGVEIPESAFPRWQRDIVAMFDQAGAVGFNHWLARVSRQNAQARMKRWIREIRAGERKVAPECAAEVIARSREPNRNLLDDRTAAVELLNVNRPIVAVSVYLTFAALALHQNPSYRSTLSDPQGRIRFAQEVRRLYPFFPALTARVRESFSWHSFEFPRGRGVLLDLYGINHDPAVWHDPMEFRPDRFGREQVTPFNFVPQGAGDAAVGHRCPGEDIATALIERTAELLAGNVRWEVPEQNLAIDYTRLPALPVSRLRVTGLHIADV